MRTPTSIVQLDTSCAATMQRARNRHWQILFVDFQAANRCDVFNVAQSMLQRTWSCAVQIDSTVHWVCTDAGMAASPARLLQRVGWRWQAATVVPTIQQMRNYVHCARTINKHHANRWWMLGALIGLDAANCTTLASCLTDYRTAWPDNLRRKIL